VWHEARLFKPALPRRARPAAVSSMPLGANIEVKLRILSPPRPEKMGSDPVGVGGRRSKPLGTAPFRLGHLWRRRLDPASAPTPRFARDRAREPIFPAARAPDLRQTRRARRGSTPIARQPIGTPGVRSYRRDPRRSAPRPGAKFAPASGRLCQLRPALVAGLKEGRAVRDFGRGFPRMPPGFAEPPRPRSRQSEA